MQLSATLASGAMLRKAVSHPPFRVPPTPHPEERA
jgi:hypothetical protein